MDDIIYYKGTLTIWNEKLVLDSSTPLPINHELYILYYTKKQINTAQKKYFAI